MKVTIEIGNGGQTLVLGHQRTRGVVKLTNRAIGWITNLMAIPFVAVLLPLIWLGEFFRKIDKFKKGIVSDLAFTKSKDDNQKP